MNKCTTHNNCIEEAIKKAEKLCLERNLKFTKLRKAVLELVWESHIPLKAYEILDRLKIKESTAQPITIYRILDFLIENNMIHKIKSQNTFIGCSHPGSNHNCYFIICTKCHVVDEGCSIDLLTSIYNSLHSINFKPQHVTLEIQGICKNCL